MSHISSLVYCVYRGLSTYFVPPFYVFDAACGTSVVTCRIFFHVVWLPSLCFTKTIPSVRCAWASLSGVKTKYPGGLQLAIPSKRLVVFGIHKNDLCKRWWAAITIPVIHCPLYISTHYYYWHSYNYYYIYFGRSASYVSRVVYFVYYLSVTSFIPFTIQHSYYININLIDIYI